MSPDLHHHNHLLHLPSPPRICRRRPPKPAAVSSSWTRRLRQTLCVPPGGKGGGLIDVDKNESETDRSDEGGGDGGGSSSSIVAGEVLASRFVGRNCGGNDDSDGGRSHKSRKSTAITLSPLLKLMLVVLLCHHHITCLVFAASAECPDQCDCKWKGGKETVECQRAGFYMVPAGLDSGTQVLDFADNNLQVLPKDTFVDVGLVHLQRIYLRQCSISQIDREAFRSLSNLVELDLSQNLLRYVPSGAFREGGPQLRRLYLSGNPLQRLGDSAFAHIPSLEIIELSDCQLESVDVTAFLGLARLARLKLDNNRLAVLRSDVMLPLVALNELYLDNNPWRCDCHLRALREWMSANRLSASVPPTCSSPARLRGRSWSEVPTDEHVCEPQITLSETSIDVQEGDNVTITCRIVANPEPAVWWMWKGRQLLLAGANATQVSVEEQRGAFAVSEDGTLSKTLNLTITLAGKDVSGTYACVAENHASVRSANLTLTVGREANESRLGFAASHITGIVIGIAAVILLLIVVLCVFTLKCKASTPKVDHKRMEANHHKMMSANHVDALARLEEQDTNLLGPNPIQKPPRLGQYHGVPTIDLDHFEKDVYLPNNVPTTWKTQVVVELTKSGGDDEDEGGVGGDSKCIKRDTEDHGGFYVARAPVDELDEKGSKDTSLMPIVEEECRESEEGDDSGLELDRGREAEVRSDAESDRERLQEKNKRNQEKRSPISLRDASALEREFFGVPGLTREKLRQGRQALQRGGSGGGGGDSTCSSSDPPTVPSSPQRQSQHPPTDSAKVLSLMVPTVLLTHPRTGVVRPTSFEDDGEEGTEV